METEASVKDDVNGDHVDYLAQDKATESVDELESTRESESPIDSMNWNRWFVLCRKMIWS